jgi:hypothetical protein
MLNAPIRIPGSRPFRLPSSKEKPAREQSWDNRFHLGKIPEYNAMQDRYIDPNKLRKPRKKIILLPGKIKKTTKPSELDLAKCVSVKSLQKPPLIQNQIVQKLTNNLISVWNHKLIPQPQRQAFLSSIEKLNAKEKSSALVKETESLKNDKNLVQAVLRSIKKREEFLKDLVDFAESIDVPTNAIKHNCVENLANLRVLTLQAIESIQVWRNKLHEFDPSSIFPFIWEDQNYLVKVQNDAQVLKKTVIGSFIEFLENDPFFVHCRSSRGGIEIPVEATIIKRVREAEIVLKNEGMKDVVIEISEERPKRLTESRSSRLFLKEETKEMTLKAIEGDIEEHILQYSLLVPEDIQNSMGKPENAYSNALSMRFPAFLWAKIDKEAVGLVTLNLENQKSMYKRLYISHISVLQLDMMPKLLEILINYIWKNYESIEIRVGIVSRINDEGKYEADKSIKQHFDKIGFRWKQMIYTMNEIPVQLLGLRRPEGNLWDKSGYSIFDDCIEMAYACTIQITGVKDTEYKQFCSVIGVACAVKPFGNSSIPDVQNIIDKIKGVPPAFRFRKDNKLENAIKDLNSVKLTTNNLEEDVETSVSCSALGLSWVKYMPSIYKGIKYTKILSQVNIMTSNSYTIYIISTEDPQYSVFFIPGYIKSDVFNFTKGLLKNIESVGESDEIWVPSFDIKAENDIETVTGSYIDGKMIGKCTETYKFKLHSALHPTGSIVLQPDTNSLIITDNFVFGMIHHKVDEELEVPLFIIQVTTDNFLN